MVKCPFLVSQLVIIRLQPSADGEWRRKYFQEKKVTSSLEDRVKRKKADILRLQAQLDRRKEARIRGKRAAILEEV